MTLGDLSDLDTGQFAHRESVTASTVRGIAK
jgi:hypothetical protein